MALIVEAGTEEVSQDTVYTEVSAGNEQIEHEEEEEEKGQLDKFDIDEDEYEEESPKGKNRLQRQM